MCPNKKTSVIHFFVLVLLQVPATRDLCLLLSINCLWMILTWFDIARQPVGKGLDLGGVIGQLDTSEREREREKEQSLCGAALQAFPSWQVEAQFGESSRRNKTRMDLPGGVSSLKELSSPPSFDIMISSMTIDNWHF